MLISYSNPKTEKQFFDLRKEGKIYISKVFRIFQKSPEIRRVKIVFEDSELVTVGEIEGELSLRQSPKGKQQVVAVISKDDKQIRRLTLQRFDEKQSGDMMGYKENAFSFRSDEFQRLISFLKSIQFIDFSNEENFQIEDLSTKPGNKALIDVAEKDVLNAVKKITGEEREALLKHLGGNLSKKDIDILLGRKDALEKFRFHIINNDWNELDWQRFFSEQKWIFGYGLDYRIMTEFDREMNVSQIGTDNKEKVIVDFLMSFNDFTVTVELKKPETPIFNKSKNRSGSWGFHSDFIEAVSQVLEQKTEWQILGQQSNLYNRVGNEKLSQRTRDAKAILVIGSKAEFGKLENVREREIKEDTFELFRRGSRNVEIITYDELLERASFIVNQ